MDSKLKGTITENLIAIKLAENDYDVWFPYMNNHRTDMIVMKNGKAAKIQAKTASYDSGTDRYRLSATTKDRNKKHIEYNKETQDFFIVRCGNTDFFYVVPCQVIMENRSLNFYPHRNKISTKARDVSIYLNAYHLIEEFLNA